MGELAQWVNRYLEWAYIEAGNAISQEKALLPCSTALPPPESPKGSKEGSGSSRKTSAEATWWMLKTQKPYKESKKEKGRKRDLRMSLSSLQGKGKGRRWKD